MARATTAQRWHNLKYYTWVEQQGKTVEELDAQRDPAWWEAEQHRRPGNQRQAGGVPQDPENLNEQVWQGRSIWPSLYPLSGE